MGNKTFGDRINQRMRLLRRDDGLPGPMRPQDVIRRVFRSIESDGPAAAGLTISHADLWRWRYKNVRPHPMMWRHLARALECSVEELAGEESGNVTDTDQHDSSAKPQQG